MCAPKKQGAGKKRGNISKRNHPRRVLVTRVLLAERLFDSGGKRPVTGFLAALGQK
jgi:hypothetical protein